MGNIEKSHHCSAINADVLTGTPLIVIVLVTLTLVVRLVVGVLDERVLDAFVEDLFSVIWSFRAWNGVGEAEIREKRREVVRMIFDIELLVKEVLDLLFFQG